VSEGRFNELLSVAAEVFCEYGLHAATVSEMARRASSSKATFYSRYPSKEKLFVAVMRRRAESLTQEFACILRTNQDVESVLLQFGHELLLRSLSDEAIQLQRIILMEGHRFPELSKAFYDAGHGRMMAQLVTYLKEKTREGTLAVPDARIAAEQLPDSLVGELLRRAVLGIEGLSAREKNLRVRVAVQAFLRAYRVPTERTAATS
jgi:AcrR family transcriptional regulator